MTDYPRGRNSVECIPFQLSQVLPQPILPLHHQIAREDLRQLVERYPTATLRQLCEQVSREQGITMSTTAMCRLVKRYQITRQQLHLPKLGGLRVVV